MSSSFRDFINTAKHPVKQQPTVKTESKNPVQQTVKTKTVKEETMENDAFNEAQTYIKNLKKKIDTVFYRFGMSGLERIDEAIIGTLNEMLHPENKKPIKESQRNHKTAPRKAHKAQSTPVVEDTNTDNQSIPQQVSTSESALEKSAKAILGVLSQQAAFAPTSTVMESKQTGSGMTMDSIEALSMALGGTPTNEEK